MKVSEQTASSSRAQRGAQWLVRFQQSDGSLRGAKSINEYYKAPFGLVVTGHNGEADRMLDYVARTYLKSDGDLDGSGCVWFEDYRIYPHSWLIIAAIMRGRFEMARSILRFLITYNDENTGGFFLTAQGQRQREGQQEIMTTGLAGLACLWAGRLDVAERTGRWMERLYNEQPSLSKGLYFVSDHQGHLVTTFSKEDARNHMVDATQLRQRYYQYGVCAVFLSSLFGATGEERWLKLAQKFLSASKHCREDVYRQPQSGKIGWGAAWTYRLSRDLEDRKIAESVTEGLRALQDEDGWWSSLSVYQRENVATIEPAIDVTGELVGLLGCIELALEFSS